MTEWTVITVLIAIVGLGATVTAPIIKLMSTITKLSCAVDGLRADLVSLSRKNSEGHGRLWEHNKAQDEKISKLEGRIRA